MLPVSSVHLLDQFNFGQKWEKKRSYDKILTKANEDKQKQTKKKVWIKKYIKIKRKKRKKNGDKKKKNTE